MFKRQAKALIRLCVCAGWSKALLVAHTALLEISRTGSFDNRITVVFSVFESTVGLSLPKRKPLKDPKMVRDRHFIYFDILHHPVTFLQNKINIWALTCDFQQCGILTSVDSYKAVQPPFQLRSSKLILQRLRSDCAFAQADLRLCWSHIPHCWKWHVTAQINI